MHLLMNCLIVCSILLPPVVQASFVEFDVPATDTSRTGLREMVSGWFYVKGASDQQEEV